MAIKPNNSLKARHVSYCCTTGAGKTVAVKLIPDWQGKCVAILDIYGDYRQTRRRKLSGIGQRKVHQYTTRATFAKAFIEAWATGKPFAVSYHPKVTGENYRKEAIWFGQLMWDASDGDRELHVVWEELAKYVETAGKEVSVIGECATGGRKFGIVNHFVYQRPAEIPKTMLSQCQTVIIGAQQTMLDAKYWERESDVPVAEIVALGVENLKDDNAKNYIIRSGAIGQYTKKTVNF